MKKTMNGPVQSSWSRHQDERLLALVEEGLEDEVIALRLGRSVPAVAKRRRRLAKEAKA